MSKHLNWYKRSPQDWQRGTRKHGMSFELRGFYSECLDAMWELQGQLPKDAKTLAMMLGTNPRLVAALMPKLIALGKIIETHTGYYNRRMMADILGLDDVKPVGVFAPVSTSIGPPTNLEPTSNQPRTKAQSRSKIAKKPTITTRDLESESEEEIDIETPLPPKGGSPTKFECLQAFQAYNDLAQRIGLAQSRSLTPERERKIRARLKVAGLDGWHKALAHIEQSGFLTGQNDRCWRADLGFVLQAESYAKLLDGAYGNGRHTEKPKKTMWQVLQEQEAADVQ